jgi:DNA-binding MarR family transcriptional regulator
VSNHLPHQEARPPREGLITRIAYAVRLHQNAVDEIDEAAAAYLGVNRTDLRCLDILERAGPMPAGRLAAESGLSSGAMTAVLDRLERAGLVRRTRGERDRRSVMAEITEEAVRRATDIYGPIGEQAVAQLRRYSDEELAFILDFLEQGRDLALGHARRVRDMTRAASTGAVKREA